MSSQVPPPPYTVQINPTPNSMDPRWIPWFQSVQSLLNTVIVNGTGVQSGPTSARPIPTIVGQTYFDTTLGEPIWCKITTGPVWVNAAGVSV